MKLCKEPTSAHALVFTFTIYLKIFMFYMLRRLLPTIQWCDCICQLMDAGLYLTAETALFPSSSCSSDRMAARTFPSANRF